VLFEVNCVVSDYNHNTLSATASEIVDATIDDGAITERKQRLELAHAPRLSGCEHDCGYVLHGSKILAPETKVIHESPETHENHILLFVMFRVFRGSLLTVLEGPKCAKRVLPRHLLAPVHDEVSVVQGPSFNVSGFGGRLNSFFIKGLTD
jgi:hypothetical protein